LYRQCLRIESLEDRTLLSLGSPVLLPQYSAQNLTGYLTGPSTADPLEIARQYLTDHAATLGLSADDAAHTLVTDRYQDPDTGVTHLYLRQEYNGLEVEGADFVVNVMADGQVINAAGGFVPGLHTPTVATAALADGPQAILSAADALRATAATLGLAPGEMAAIGPADSRGVVAPGSTPECSTLLVDHSLSSDSIPSRLHYVPSAGGGVALAWQFVLRTPDGQHWYQTSAAAATGETLCANDWVDQATYNVYPRPVESPADGSRSLQTDPANATASPYGWHDTNGVAGAEYTDTRGNNVFAQEDADANNTGGTRPDGGSGLSFDFSLDLGQSPSAYRSAAITNLFYWNNICHDVHAAYGFTEAAGNFQVANYSGQGSGNDAVQADAQDGAGTNNANFATPPDGSAPRMQMFVFTYTSPYRDGDLDNQIIVHEYGHGVSNRLVGGPSNANALTAVQSGAMGEGWSDWWGLMFTQKATDTKTARYPVGTYVLGQSSSGSGIRRYPYCYDMAVNPLTYGNIRTYSEVHDAGEVWCSALWDLNWLLIDKYGFNANLQAGYAPGAAGNVLALKLVMDSLKLMPANPSFLQARNAILQADQVLTGGANLAAIWTAFARRGMGYTASDGGSASSTYVTEAFDLPFFQVSSHTPNGVTTQAPTVVDFTFNKGLQTSSFSLADDVVSFTGPDGGDLRTALTGFSFPSSNTLRLSFTPPTLQGEYRLTIGPQILTGSGQAMDQNANAIPGQTPDDQYTAVFCYDALVLNVASTTPAAGATFTVTTPSAPLVVTFNEPYAPASIDLNDLTLSRGAVVGFELIDATRVQYDITGLNTEAQLGVSLAAGAVTDVYGNPCRTFSSTYPVDVASGIFPATTALLPYGSLIYEGSVAGGIGSASDSDGYALALDPGQSLTVLLVPASGLRGSVTVTGGDGSTLASASAVTAGARIVVQNLPVSAAGTYFISAAGSDGTTGTYTLTVDLNAALEDEAQGGATNNALATAQSLDAAFLPQGAYVERAAVLGTAAGATDNDYYALTLNAGDVLWAGLKNTSGSGTTLALLDAAGTVLGMGAAAGTSLDSKVGGFHADASGTYYLRVGGGATAISYRLVATKGGNFDEEPNDSLSAAQDGAGFSGVLGYLSGTSDAGDYYRLPLNAGDVFTASTVTPGDGLNQFVNFLDPKLELYDPSGALVVGDDNGAADGRNALLTHAAASTGDYVVRVQSAANSGEYVVQFAGATGSLPAFAVTALTPANAARVTSAPTTLTVTFNDSLRVDSLTNADLLLDGVPLTTTNAPTFTNGKTVVFSLPAGLGQGLHSVAFAAGCALDLQGTPLVAFSSTFFVDSVAPRIIASSIVEGDVLLGTVLTYNAEFDEDMNTTVLSLGDFSLVGAYGGTRTVSSYTWSDARHLVLQYVNLPEDTYTLKLLSAAGSFQDQAGNLLDGEAHSPFALPSGDGTAGGDFVVHFATDLELATLGLLAVREPAGSLIYDTSTSGLLHAAGDVDSFTIDLDPGQLLTVYVDPTGSVQLQSVLTIVAPDATVLATATAVAAGNEAVLQNLPLGQAGTYTVLIAASGATSGPYTVHAQLNAAVEMEYHDGPANDSLAAAQALDSAFITFGSPTRRAAVAGVVANSTDSDYYALTLAAGEVFTAVADLSVTSSPILGVLDTDGTLLADSVSGSSNVDRIIGGFTASHAGTYYVRIGGGFSNYNLLIVVDSAFDTESNDSATYAQDTAGAGGAWGYLTGTGDIGDYYRVAVNAGDVLSFATQVPADGSYQVLNDLDPKLALYNPSGNVVASDDNGAGDGRNARINHTALVTGNYAIRVQSAGSSGEYLVAWQGATGSLPPFNVASTTPANDVKLTIAPTTISVVFNDNVRRDSLTNSDLLLDGAPFSSSTAPLLTSAKVALFTLPSSMAPGTHTISLAAGSVVDWQNTPVAAYAGSFLFDNVAPRLSASSIGENDVVPAGPCTYMATFDEDMNTTVLDASDFALLGQVSGAQTASSFGWSDARHLTLQFADLPDDRYTLTLLSGSGRFLDPTGNLFDGEPHSPFSLPSGDGIAGGNFVVHFSVDTTTAAFPALSAVNPTGSMVYEGERRGWIGTTSDTDVYTLELDAAQQLTVVVMPDAALRSMVTISDPFGAVLASGTSENQGWYASLPAVPINTPGSYHITVSGDAGSTGAYVLRAKLNSAVENEAWGGLTNDTSPTAQPLDAAFQALPGGGRRAALQGTLTQTIASWSMDTNPGWATYGQWEWGKPTGSGGAYGPPDPTAGYTGTNVCGVNLNGDYNTTGGPYYLTTSAIDCRGRSNVQLSFARWLNIDHPPWASATVEVSNNGSTWSTIYTSSNTVQESTWTGVTYDIHAVADNQPTVYIRWGYNVTYINYVFTFSGWNIDDVALWSSTGADVDHYSVTLAAGETLAVGLKNVSGSGTSLKLLDANGVLLSTAVTGSTNWSLGISGFTAPAAGMYYLQVGGANNVAYNLGVTTGSGLDMEPNDSLSAAQDWVGHAAVSGALSGTADPGDYYRVSVNAGDGLTISTSTPADGPYQFTNLLDPKLELYGPSGELLASNDNSAADGRNALLLHMATATGLYTIRAFAAASSGEYMLRLQGATGDLPAFAVATTTPAPGAKLTAAPTILTVAFNDALRLDTLQNSDVSFDGVPLAGTAAPTIADSKTVSFILPTGLAQGTHTISLAAGSVLDLQGTPLAAFNSSLVFDNIAPQVVASSLAEGDYMPAAALTYTVAFDEDMLTTAVDSSDFSLVGAAGGSRSASSFSWSDARHLTIEYTGLADDSYTLALWSASGRFQDAAGNILDGEPHTPYALPSGNGTAGGDFVVHFAMDGATTALPAPAAKQPLGSLVYETSASRVIGVADDVDSFTWDLDVGQLLSVCVLPGTSLQGVVTVTDPSGTTLGSATASAAGKHALLQTLPVSTSGTYTITVSGSGGTTGSYTLQADLNAALEAEAHDGTTNDTWATAQDLDAAMLTVGAGQRAAVLGTVVLGPLQTFASWNLDSNPGWSVQGEWAWGQPTGGGGPFGSPDPTAGRTGANVLGVNLNGNYSTVVGGPYYLTTTAIDCRGRINVFLNFWRWLNTDFSSWVTSTVDVSNNGSTWTNVYNSSAMDYAWRLQQFDIHTVADNQPTVYIRWGYQVKSRAIAYSGWNVDDVSLSAPDADGGDRYSLTLAAGQSASLAVQTLSTGSPTLELYNSAGQLLALGVAATNLSQVVANFVAPADGVYYARVTGNSINYSLLATKGALVDAEANDSMAAAQEITGVGSTLGYLSGTADTGDYYRAAVNAGDQLRFTTFTPADGPNLFANALNPKLELYNPSGTLVASDDNGAADGRNVLLNYTAPLTGNYTIRVRAAASSGEYMLKVEGATGSLPAFAVASISPAGNARISVAPSTVTVTFNDSVRRDSIDNADLLIDGVPSTGTAAPAFSDPKTVVFTLPAVLAQGTHTLALGAGSVANWQNTPLAAYTSGFLIDGVAPRIVASSIVEGDCLTSNSLTYTAEFSEDMEPIAVTTAPFVLTGLANGYRSYSAYRWSDPRHLVLEYANLADDDYTLTLKSSSTGFRDLAGNFLDGEPHTPFSLPSGDGTAGGDFVVHFTYETTTAAFPALGARNPLGSLVYEGTFNGQIGLASDSDSYTMPLDEGQRLSIVITSTGGLQAQVTITDPSGTEVATALSTAGNAPLIVPNLPVTTSGVYTITLAGDGSTTGSYTILVDLNATVEAERFGGAANNTLGAAQLLAPAPLGLDRHREAVIGRVTGTTDSDYYAVTLAAGDVLFVALSNLSGSGTTLSLLSAAGLPLGTGASATNLSLALGPFTAPTAGDYYMKVAGGSAAVDYNLVLTIDGVFDKEGNDARTSAQELSGTRGASGYLSGTADIGDYYRLLVNAGDALSFSTALPAAGPYQFDNPLDPRLELYDPSGALVASDDNGAPDGRNALLYHPALATGSYVVRVRSAANSGVYTLSSAGATGGVPDFAVSSTTPSQGALLTVAPTVVTVAFSDSIRLDSLENADLLLDGVPLASTLAPTLVNAATATFTLPAAIAQGVHTIALAAGSVTNLRDTPLVAYSGSFRYDSIGPRVIASSIAENDVLPSGVLTYTAVFDEEMNTTVLDASDFSLVGANSGARAASSFSWIDARHLQLQFAGLGDDSYTLTLQSAAGRFLDPTGNLLDGEPHTPYSLPSGDGVAGGNFVVHFGVETSTTAFPDLVGVNPLGSLVYEGTLAAEIGVTGDSDSYTLALDAGQQLTVYVVPGSGLQSTLTITAPDGSVLANATALAVGKQLVVQEVPISVAGTYAITVGGSGGTTGAYTLRAELNAAVESESHDGAANDSPAAAQTLDLTSVFSDVGLRRAAVLGSVATTSDQDWYGLTLAAGEMLTALVKSTSGSGLRLSVFDGAGTELATGVSATNADRVIGGFCAPAGGVYYLEVSSSSPIAGYALVAIANGGFDIESNDSTGGGQEVWGPDSALGYLTGSSDTGDYYRISATVGDLLSISTRTPGDGPFQLTNVLDPRIDLYDSQGIRVATNDNGAADGRNARLSYVATVTGSYVVRVRAAANAGEYLLLVQGRTDAAPAFTVSYTTPGSGGKNSTEPTTVSVVFSDGVRLDSVANSDLLFDGVPLAGTTAPSFVDGKTVVFTLPGGLAQGTHAIALADGSVLDLRGAPLAAYSTSFLLDGVAPRLIASSIAEADVLPTGSLTYTAEFDEDMPTTTLDTGDFTLVGTIGGSRPATSYTWLDARHLVLVFADLAEDDYTLTLSSGSGKFADPTGNYLDGEPHTPFSLPTGNGVGGGDFVVHFTTEITEPVVLPLRAVLPLGSLVYEGTSSGLIRTAGDVDAYTLELNAAQQLSVSVIAASGLQAALTIFAPDGSVLATTTAMASGVPVRVQSLAVAAAGSYTICVASGGSLGQYDVQVYLNAAIEEEEVGGPSNSTWATAQSLDAAFLSLGGAAQRAAVWGSAGKVGLTQWNLDSNPGWSVQGEWAWGQPTGGGGSYGFHDPTAGYTGFNVFGVNLNGNYSATVGSPYYLTTTAIDCRGCTNVHLNFWRWLNTLSTSLATSTVDVSNNGSTWTNVYNSYATDSTWQPQQFDIHTVADNQPTVYIRWGYQVKSTSLPSSGWNIDDISLTGDVADDDYYSVTLAAGQTLSAAIENTPGTDTGLMLLDAAGAVLVTALPEGANSDLSIAGFVAPAAGTYYLRVTGATPASHYNLVVTRGGIFDREPNSTAAVAQPLGCLPTALGYLAGGDDDWYALTLPDNATLSLWTTTPGDTGGQFANALRPRLRLYDATGTVVATGVALADGHNQIVTATLPPGVYRARLTALGNTAGEYVLHSSVSGAAAAVLVTTGLATEVVEGGYTDTYQVSLTAPPLDNVIVALAGSEGLVAVDRANPSQAYLTFTPTNWHVPQTVLIAAVDDALRQGPRVGTIAHAISSGDPRYAVSVAPNVSVAIIDNDETPAVARDDSYDIPAGSSLVVPAAIGLLANDSDAQSDPLSAVLVAAPLHGTLDLRPDGSFDYTADPGFQGVDAFTYTAFDGFGNALLPATVYLRSHSPRLLGDIAATPAGQGAFSGVVYGNVLLFVGADSVHGAELWRTDGTPGGTYLVMDIYPGCTSSGLANLTMFQDRVYFTANDGVNGTELWSTDGTAAGTALVADINPGASSSSPSMLTVVGDGLLCFTAMTTTYGRELWRSDGTAAGTALIQDLATGTASATLSLLTACNGWGFFTTSVGGFGTELWKTDGTAAGTGLVKDIYPGSSGSSPSSLTKVGNTLFFAAYSPGYGTELWKTDGSAAGTQLVRDIYAGVGSSSPANLVDVNGTLFFSATASGYGTELWCSDGTVEGTYLVKDISAGSSSSSSANLVNVGGTLFFRAGNSSYGAELWKSDGTPAGTVLVKDIVSGSSSSNPANLVNAGGTLFFTASDATSGAELWRSDGTADGTTLVADILPGVAGSSPAYLLAINGEVYFRATDATHGAEIWHSDGTAAGTSLLGDLNTATGDSAAANFAVVGNTLFFQATDGLNGAELWKSDGTATGTALVKDINIGAGSSSPSTPVNVNGTIFFSASDAANGAELWKSDGTAAGTVLVKDIYPGTTGSSLSSLINVGGTLFFVATDGVTGAELWKSDGTAAGTVLVKDIYPGATGSTPSNFRNVGGTLFFVATDDVTGTELWKSDGTLGGTVLVKDILPGTLSSSPSNLFQAGGKLYFAAADGITGTELWTSDGTAGGTVLVNDLNPGAASSSPTSFTVLDGVVYFTAHDGVASRLRRTDGTVAGTWAILAADGLTPELPSKLLIMNGRLYFQAFDAAHGYELWTTDGTAAGAQLVLDVWPGADSGYVTNPIVVNNCLVFASNDGAHGTELWVSDGTPAGTSLLKEFRPGSGSSSFASLGLVNGQYLFGVSTGNGRELWQTDGTLAGTQVVAHLLPGDLGYEPTSVAMVGNALVFLANDAQTGRELWFLPEAVAPTARIASLSPAMRTTPVESITITFDEPVSNLDLADLQLTRDGVNVLTGGETLTTADGVAWVLGGLSSANAVPGRYTLVLHAAGAGIRDFSGNLLADDVGVTWQTEVAVVGRHVFYNNSAFDGNDPAANAADDNAIAPDKMPLLPGGTATFANYTSYVRGLNGIIIDIGGLPAQLTAADFEFRTGNDNNPAAWTLSMAPTISIRWGEGTLLPDGVTHADRVTLTWNDYYVLQNGVWVLNPSGIGQKWLQVTVKATANTGLSQDDVFYFGNAIGESGDSATSAAVNILDFGGTRDNPHNAFNRAAITDAYDFDRDQFVNIVDLGLVRDNGTNAFNDLNLITVPASPSPADAAQGGTVAGDAPAEAVLSAGPTPPLLDTQYAPLGAILAGGASTARLPLAATVGISSNVDTADSAVGAARQPLKAGFAARDAALATTSRWSDGGMEDEIAAIGRSSGPAVLSPAKGSPRRR